MSTCEQTQMNATAPGLTYRLLALMLYPVWVIHALQHGRSYALDRYRSMRMSHESPDQDRPNQDTPDHDPRIWVHAASVGEVRAITPLVQALIDGGHKILFTSFTASGFQAIQRDLADSVRSTVIPIDCYWHCRRFFAGNNIKLGLIMETELWPELLYQARHHDIELLLVNARLSARSLETNRFVRALLAHTLGYFSQILTRSVADQQALKSLGASPARIRTLGNLKAQHRPQTNPTRLVAREYLLLASSHAGEELAFLAARPAAAQPKLLVIAPRHPARSKTIQAEIDGLGLRYAVRSRSQPVTAETEVYLADTLGELSQLMAHAEVVIMGGSFDDTGGHNLIEPASLGCAIITGPSDSNIDADIKMLGAGQGVIQVTTIDACCSAIMDLLEQPELEQALAKESQARLARQPDILQVYLDAIEHHLPARSD
jgi:3-deoxy-D-manno-octulosonic-acid transferase